MIIIAKKREKGIRNIKIKGKNVRFKRGVKFKSIKSEAKKSQEVFQERGHLTRIFSARIPIKHKGVVVGSHKGYFVWYSEKRIREKGVDF